MGYDVFFLEFDEPNAEENFQRLSEFCRPIRVSGVMGILNAHKQCARMSGTKMFWVVDGDCWVYDNIDFKFKPENTENVYNWAAKNPVNGLEYGYGGVKLLPKRCVLDADSVIDMTTTVGKHFIYNEDVTSETRFNTSPFHAWRSGFREVSKLYSSIIQYSDQTENQYRIEHWSTRGMDALYGWETMNGANDAKDFIMSGGDIKKINDYEFLKERYELATNA